MSDPFEYIPPFLSPLTHDQHARLGRISILWGQIDMMVDVLITHVVGLTTKQRHSLVGEKPLGTKLDLLSSHIDDAKPASAKAAIAAFVDHAHQTKGQRNRCFHGVWGFRVMPGEKMVAAAQHFKNGNDPVRAEQLPALEKKLCKTARLGIVAVNALGKITEEGSTRLFHGASADPPAWFHDWQEEHPVSDDDMDHRWKEGQLPFLTKPL